MAVARGGEDGGARAATAVACSVGVGRYWAGIGGRGDNADNGARGGGGVGGGTRGSGTAASAVGGGDDC